MVLLFLEFCADFGVFFAFIFHCKEISEYKRVRLGGGKGETLFLQVILPIVIGVRYPVSHVQHNLPQASGPQSWADDPATLHGEAARVPVVQAPPSFEAASHLHGRWLVAKNAPRVLLKCALTRYVEWFIGTRHLMKLDLPKTNDGKSARLFYCPRCQIITVSQTNSTQTLMAHNDLGFLLLQEGPAVIAGGIVDKGYVVVGGYSVRTR